MNSSVAIDTNPRGAPQNDRNEHPVGHAWVAIGAFVFMTIVGTLGAAKVMNYLFPVSSFLLSFFLFHRYPIFFNSFVWWLFFLSPLIRRIVDYKSVFTNPSPVLLAPILAVLVILPSFIKCFPKAGRDGTVPFAVAASGITYGLLIGYLNHVPLNKLIIGTLGWMAPVLYGFFISINWRRYPEFYKNFQRTLLWGILIMGIYGVYQYLVLPEWDRLWLINAEFTVAGNPSPREIRVWSTMNSGEPFSAVMAAGLILILDCRGTLFTGSAIAGYVTFMLTLVRSGWVGWLGGMFILFATSKPKFQMRLTISAITLACLVIPIAIANSFFDVISARFSTLSDLENDNSATVRQGAYQDLDNAFGNFLGDGISDSRMDSSIFSLLSELGWTGGILYSFGLIGLLILCWKALKVYSASSSRLLIAAAFTSIIRIPVNTTLTNVSGMMLWACLAFVLAGARHDYHQKSMHNKN
jgi:hypothetical protein